MNVRMNKRVLMFMVFHAIAYILQRAILFCRFAQATRSVCDESGIVTKASAVAKWNAVAFATMERA